MQDRSVHRNVVWDGETNCDSPREGYLWDLDIAVIWCTFVWHLVWKVKTKVVVLGDDRRGSFREVGQICQEDLLQKGSVACCDGVGHR